MPFREQLAIASRSINALRGTIDTAETARVRTELEQRNAALEAQLSSALAGRTLLLGLQPLDAGLDRYTQAPLPPAPDGSRPTPCWRKGEVCSACSTPISTHRIWHCNSAAWRCVSGWQANNGC